MYYLYYISPIPRINILKIYQYIYMSTKHYDINGRYSLESEKIFGLREHPQFYGTHVSHRIAKDKKNSHMNLNNLNK